jgi:two-component system chemotaxis response regulator CheB
VRWRRAVPSLAALDQLIGQVRSDLCATLFIVQHMAAESNGDALLHQLRKHDAFDCKLAEKGETFKQGTIYIAPPES